MSRLLSGIVYHAATLYLFTKSDILTTLIPVSIFACTSAPREQWHRLAHIIAWTWLHLLQADLSNQTVHPEEDELNKPYRPLPSRRISLRNAKVLRWIMIPLCLLLSSLYSLKTVQTSVVFATLVILYNECGLGNDLVTRNLLNAAGLACLETGSALTASGGVHLEFTVVFDIGVSAAVVATTIQIQDFRDMKGDARHGRRTVPIVFPAGARETTAIILLGWSIFLSHFWRLAPAIAVVFIGLAGYVGGRLVAYRTSVGADERSYAWYRVWLIFVHALHRFAD